MALVLTDSCFLAYLVVAFCSVVIPALWPRLVCVASWIQVIEFCRHYKEDPMNEIEKPLKSANMHDVVQEWYAKFVEVRLLYFGNEPLGWASMVVRMRFFGSNVFFFFLLRVVCFRMCCRTYAFQRAKIQRWCISPVGPKTG